MLAAVPEQKIFLATEPVDMRGGFDRLAGRVIQAGHDLYAGHLFVFVSKRRIHLKILTWDGSGLVIFYKRISKGRFPIPKVHSDGRTALLDPAELATLLNGCEIRGVRGSHSRNQKHPKIDSADEV